jgi:hypothetical protein
VFIFRKLQEYVRRLRRRPKPNELPADKVAQRDLGVKVVRIRLPSGYEIVIVEQDKEE